MLQTTSFPLLVCLLEPLVQQLPNAVPLALVNDKNQDSEQVNHHLLQGLCYFLCSHMAQICALCEAHSTRRLLEGSVDQGVDLAGLIGCY